MDDELDDLITALIEVADELEMYGYRNNDNLAANLGDGVRSLGMLARIERRDSSSNSGEGE